MMRQGGTQYGHTAAAEFHPVEGPEESREVRLWKTIRCVPGYEPQLDKLHGVRRLNCTSKDLDWLERQGCTWKDVSKFAEKWECVSLPGAITVQDMFFRRPSSLPCISVLHSSIDVCVDRKHGMDDETFRDVLLFLCRIIRQDPRDKFLQVLYDPRLIDLLCRDDLPEFTGITLYNVNDISQHQLASVVLRTKELHICARRTINYGEELCELLLSPRCRVRSLSLAGNGGQPDHRTLERIIRQSKIQEYSLERFPPSPSIVQALCDNQAVNAISVPCEQYQSGFHDLQWIVPLLESNHVASIYSPAFDPPLGVPRMDMLKMIGSALKRNTVTTDLHISGNGDGSELVYWCNHICPILANNATRKRIVDGIESMPKGCSIDVSAVCNSILKEHDFLTEDADLLLMLLRASHGHFARSGWWKMEV